MIFDLIAFFLGGILMALGVTLGHWFSYSSQMGLPPTPTWKDLVGIVSGGEEAKESEKKPKENRDTKRL